MAAFFTAVQTGDVKKVESLLAKDARAVMDRGGQVKTALNVIRGADRVARLFTGLTTKIDPNLRYEVREVNGWPALIVLQNQAIVRVAAIETDGDVVFASRSA